MSEKHVNVTESVIHLGLRLQELNLRLSMLNDTVTGTVPVSASSSCAVGGSIHGELTKMAETVGGLEANIKSLEMSIGSYSKPSLAPPNCAGIGGPYVRLGEIEKGRY